MIYGQKGHYNCKHNLPKLQAIVITVRNCLSIQYELHILTSVNNFSL